MKLSRVEIKNFRSIKSETINFGQSTFLGLVGKNEAGKSNILKALSLLNGDVNVEVDDLRDELPEDESFDDGYVRFIFEFSEDEKQSIYKDCLKAFLVKDPDQTLVTFNGNPLNLRQFINNKREVLYQIGIKSKDKYFTHWRLSKSDYNVLSIIKSIKQPIPNNIVIPGFDGTDEQLQNISAVNTVEWEFPADYVTEMDINILNNIVSKRSVEKAKDLLPKCIIWSYKESNLLPGKIDLNSFKNNPNICIPLKNMFRLAGIEDIGEKISSAELKQNGMRNLLNRVSQLATNHLKMVWKEKNNIKIFLQENGSSIDAGILDNHNVYDFNRRSDGFKRFLTFLLMISTENQSEKLEDTLIIIDEPDMGLHPSGSKDLLQELIKISRTNYVVFSTHSIFMIDRSRVSEYKVVKKDGEVSTIIEYEKSDVVDEEVLYNAMGFSIFEVLKQRNIIFEGWRDKKLFEIALSSTKRGFTSEIRTMQKVGTCFANGVKDIPRIASLLQLASKEYIIISDSDAPAIERKRSFPEENVWFDYSELTNNKKIITAEDFVSTEKILNVLNPILEINSIHHIESKNIVDDSSGKMAFITNYVSSHVQNKELTKKILNQFKTELFNSIDQSHIDLTYFEMIKNLCEKCD